MKLKFQNRLIEIDEFSTDEECAYVNAAFWLDTERELNEDELNALSSDAEIADALMFETACRKADSLYDKWKDQKYEY
jgi:hypothetical protein